MTKFEAIEWCQKLTEGWKNIDFDLILNIFSDIEMYYEDPFTQPGTTKEDVKGFWEDIIYQDIKQLSIYPIAIEGNIVVARWYLDYIDTRTKENFIMDGIYQMEFNACKKCVKFIQWWVMKE